MILGEDIQPLMVLKAVHNKEIIYSYVIQMSKFIQMPDKRFIFWISNKTIEILKTEILESKVSIKQGITTSDNERFLRFWYETCINNIGFGCTSEEAKQRF